MNYFLKKNLRNYQQASTFLKHSNLILNPVQPVKKKTTLYFKAGLSTLLKALQKTTTQATPLNGFNSSYKNLLKSTCLLYGQGTPRYERLYLFLKQISKLKKQQKSFTYKRLVGLLKIMTLNNNVTLLTKRTNQNSSQNLQLYQTLNDYFFSPSFYFNINKGSR